MFRNRFLAAVALAVLAILPGTSQAQTFPSKPLKLIVPFGAGSTSDVIARLLGNSMGADLGQSVVIENRPGAGGTIGATEAARAAPDGHVLVFGTVASHAVAPSMMQGVKYDPVRDFQPITIIANAPAVVAVHRSVPANNIRELVDYIKANPGMGYSSAGTGTTTHLAGEALKLAAGVNMVHVPYKAVGQAITDLLSGTVKLMFYQLPSVKPYVASHGLKIIAVTSAKRMSALPDVPTVAETYPGFDFSAWFGMFAPAGTPRPVVDRLYKSMQKAIETPEFKQIMADQGLEPGGIAPDDFSTFLKSDVMKWKRVITATGAKLE